MTVSDHVVLDCGRPSNIPELTAFARLDYREQASWLGTGPDWSAFANLGWSYLGDRAANAANDFFLDAYHMIDARAGLSVTSGCEFYVFGTNLLDVIPELTGSLVAPGIEFVVPDRGRIVGIGAAARW